MTRSLIRRFACLLAAAAAVASMTVSAAAAGPTKTAIPNPSGPFPVCSFPINLSTVANNETVKTFSNPARMQTEGRLVIAFQASFTNGSTQTLTLNLSGPGKTVTNPDGSATVYFYGNGAVFAVVNGADVVLKTTGQFVVNVSTPSTTVFGPLVFAAGRATNICDLFSPPAS